jgi:hypothetical protein
MGEAEAKGLDLTKMEMAEEDEDKGLDLVPERKRGKKARAAPSSSREPPPPSMTTASSAMSTKMESPSQMR